MPADPDAPTRVERLLNLLAFLLDTARARPRDEIVREVVGYPAGREAARRAFERDKETLRAMGVPLAMEPVAGGEPGELGYRVPPEEYGLDLDLDEAETAALRVAVQAIGLGSDAGEGALRKLGTAADEPPVPLAALTLLGPLPTLFDAHRRRRPVRFPYRDAGRAVDPWGLVTRRGRWYVVGWDRDRAALRTFRVDRIGEPVETVEDGPPFTVPAGFRAGDVVDREPWALGDGPPETARIRVDAAHAEGVTGRPGVTVVDERADGSVEVELAVTDRVALRTFVLGFLEHAEVLGPSSLRAEMVAWLRACAGDPG